MREFIELKMKREQMQATINALDEAIMRIQTHSVSTCIVLQESAKKIIDSIQEYDHSFFSEGINQEIKKMRDCISSLERTIRGMPEPISLPEPEVSLPIGDVVGSEIKVSSPSVVPNQIKPSNPRWWEPFLKFDIEQYYTCTEIFRITGYGITQIKKQFSLHKIGMNRTLTNVWVYNGADIYNKAREMTGREQVKSNIKRIIEEKVQPDGVYKISDIAIFLSIPYSQVVKKFGHLKSARDSEGALGFVGQSLLDEVACMQ